MLEQVIRAVRLCLSRMPPLGRASLATVLTVDLLLALSVAERIRERPAPVRPEFELASIRPHAPSQEAPQMMTSEHGRLTYLGAALRALVRKAYGRKVSPLSNGPSALSTDRYDIVATAHENASGAQTMLMLRTLLGERFNILSRFPSRARENTL